MSLKRVLLLVAALVVAAFVLTACAGAPGEPGPAGPAGLLVLLVLPVLPLQPQT